MDAPTTLIEAVRYFSDQDRCETTMRKSRWPGGVPVCPECGSKNIGEIKTRRLLRCRDCRRQIYTKRGTIFEDSPLGLDKWLVAVWAIANCENGVSSHELARALGVTQKTAWFMLHRVRTAMEIDGGDKFDGPAEADTTYIGGRAENMHAAKREKMLKGARGSVGKTAVHGVLASPERIIVAKALRSFERLLKRVVSVPKAKVEARIAQKKAANIARRAESTDDPQKK